MVFRAMLTRSHVEYYLSMEVTGVSETLVTTHNVDGVVTQKTTAIISKFKVCKSVHHHTIQINHQLDETISPF
jgi:hypothetical protein